MTLSKCYPFADFAQLPKLFDTFSHFLAEPSGRPWVPAIDVLETENALVVKADLPGVDLKDIDIHLEDGTLTLKGERKFETVEEGRNRGYHRLERGYGNFVRCFTIPETVEADQVQAAFHNGVLTVTLPKKEVAKPRNIKIQVSNN